MDDDYRPKASAMRQGRMCSEDSVRGDQIQIR